MSYLAAYENDIFISYAHVDNQPFTEGQGGWVDQFYRSFKDTLARQLGRNDLVSIWRDIRLSGNSILQPSILQACRRSGILLCITSPGYMASKWCGSEYEEFCSANGASDPPRYKTSSRVFNIRLRELSSSLPYRVRYEEMFGQSLGYRFADPDSDLPLWPTPPVDSASRYWLRIEDLVRDIRSLLEGMRGDASRDREPTVQFVLVVRANPLQFDRREAEEFLGTLRNKYGDDRIELISSVQGSDSVRLVLEAPRSTYLQLNESDPSARTGRGRGVGVPAVYPGNLDGILLQAKERLMISGHTINRFSHDDRIRDALRSVLERGTQVSMIVLNPQSKYAQAHTPYHQLESGRPSQDQHDRALEFFQDLFQSLDEKSRERLEVLMSNYMPRFRTIIVDDQRVYLYLYMYGEDVSDYPDFVFEKDEGEGSASGIFTKIVRSTQSLAKAPEAIPFIRYGRMYGYWKSSKLAQWDCWSSEVRNRHRMTHRYYVEHAVDFDRKFGDFLENYVKEHLDLLAGRAIVLGCGSGKEVEYLAGKGRCHEILGVDFSPLAITLAKSKLAENDELTAEGKARCSYLVADFYDFEHISDRRLDSIVANAALVHLFEREDMRSLLRCFWEKLNPGGRCFIRNLYKDNAASEGEYHPAADRFRDPRWFVYYSRSELAELAAEAGFVVENGETRKIAKRCGFGDFDTVMTKGFRHAQYPGVYWPTVLLRKPALKSTRR